MQKSGKVEKKWKKSGKKVEKTKRRKYLIFRAMKIIQKIFIRTI